MNFVVYGQKETLFKRRHTNFELKVTISLRLAGVQTKCSLKRSVPLHFPDLAPSGFFLFSNLKI